MFLSQRDFILFSFKYQYSNWTNSRSLENEFSGAHAKVNLNIIRINIPTNANGDYFQHDKYHFRPSAFVFANGNCSRATKASRVHLLERIYGDRSEAKNKR
jgi:hypothetical protein